MLALWILNGHLTLLNITFYGLNGTKYLYNAILNVKLGPNLSSDIVMSEGVLQREVLSPYLFLSDLEKKIMEREGISGLNIDGLNELLVLLYADDLIILSYSYVDMKRKLKALEEYCHLNSLKVNPAKTKIIKFHRGRNSFREFFFFMNILKLR